MATFHRALTRPEHLFCWLVILAVEVGTTRGLEQVTRVVEDKLGLGRHVTHYF